MIPARAALFVSSYATIGNSYSCGEVEVAAFVIEASPGCL